MITVTKLKIGANLLQKEFDSEKSRCSDNFEAKVVFRYCQQILHQLTAILNEPQTSSSLISQLELLLQDNWQRVKGTSLSYTALPNQEVTEMLCAVAHYIAQERNQGKLKTEEPIGSVKLLMPTVCTDSISNDYPSLEPSFDENLGAWVDISLAKVLQTHILSSDGLSLFPVQLFAKLDTDIDSERIANPYFDYRIHSQDAAYLNEDEYERLITHSTFTKAIVDAKQYYETFLADGNHLLGHLRVLCSKLVFNSVQVAGAEFEAEVGAYEAIKDFNTYYQMIGNEKDKIPSALRLKIENLFKLILDPAFNLEGFKNGKTCIVDIRRDLANAILGDEIQLSAIAVQGENKAAQLSLAQDQFNLSKRALSEAVNTGSYAEGSDKQGLTLPLLKHLGINFAISSDRDLKTIQYLSPAAITDFFRNRKLQQQLIRQLSSTENLVSFFMALSPERLHALLAFVALPLSQSILNKPRDLLALFTGLDNVRCQLVCDLLKMHFKSILTSVSLLSQVLRYLEPERLRLVSETFLDMLQNEILQLIGSADDFNELLRHLSLEQREYLFAAVQHKIVQLIQSTSDFKTFLHYLNPQQRTVVYKLLKSSLPKMLKGSWDVSNVLEYLNAAEREESFNDFLKAWIVPHFVESDARCFLSEVFKHLDNVQCQTICELLRGKFTSIEHFLRVFASLESDKKSIFYGALRAEVPQLIHSAADFCPIFPHLSPEECKSILQSCQSNQDDFPSWNFSRLLANSEHYSEAHREVVYAVLKDYLPQSRKQVYYLLQNFSVKHGEAIHERLKVELPWMIQSGIEFKETLHYLSVQQREFIYELLKAHLPQIIHSAEDLQAVLAYLTPIERSAVCTAMKDRLLTLLVSTQALTDLLWILPLQGRKVVYEAMIGKTVLHEINDDFLLLIEAAQVNIKPATHLLRHFCTENYADKQKKLNAPKMQFELALANANLSEINSEFNTLMRYAGGHRSYFFYRGVTLSCTELIESIAKLKNKQHLERLSDALDLGLNAKDLNYPRTIEKALFHYIKDCQHSGKLTANPPIEVSL